MCGIAGTLVFQQGRFCVTEPYILQMCETLSHRGPDGAGTWISGDRRVGLGHRRLSIIDLSEQARQPMCNEDQTLWISFNGEIYNHGELRAELERSRNYLWRTSHSDTEVILHAFEEWGIDCLQKLRGMFAMAIWNAKAGELWLVRDRLGVKPLYYSIHHGRIVFASEIKALLLDPEQRRAINEDALFHYLSFLTTPAPDTLFVGIAKVRSGHWLRINMNGQVCESQYWNLWDHTAPLTGASEDDIACRLLEALRESVHLHMASDVPVGVFLSGGVDSSLNAALFSERSNSPVRTFTVGYHEEFRNSQRVLHPKHQMPDNEFAFARHMAEHIGAEHHERLLTAGDLMGFLPEVAYLQDEPLADPVCLPLYYLSQLARSAGVTVCQVGEGADELFWGYPLWKRLLRLQRLNDLPGTLPFKKLGCAGMRFLSKEDTVSFEYLRRGAASVPLFWGGAQGFTDSQKKELLSSRLRRRFGDYTSWEAIKPLYQRFLVEAWEKTPLQWMSYLDLHLRLPELLLMRVDKMGMAVGLEGRVPFLDHKLVELAMSIPEAVKTRNGTLKYILRKAVRGLIPDQLIDRNKQGFGFPMYEWFLLNLKPTIKNELSLFCSQTGLLDSRAAARLIEDGRAAHCWSLLNLALWWKRFLA